MLGCWLRRRFAMEQAVDTALSARNARDRDRYLDKARTLAGTAEDTPSDILSDVPADTPTKPLPEAPTPAPVRESAPASEPEAEPASLPREEEGEIIAVASEEDLPGRQPRGLRQPRDGRGDDLTRISGVGKKIQQRLHEIGVWHYDQIARWDADECAWFDAFVGFPGKVEREDWIAQVKALGSARDHGSAD